MWARRTFTLISFGGKQDLSRKCSAWKDFGLLFWSLLLQRKSKVGGLRWGGMDDLEVESVVLDTRFLVSPIHEGWG